ncbi:MAG: SRPBCC family protein [Crocinitomicaceae bacterium]
MKFTQEITIDLPREKVIELFDNPDNMQHWQKGLISFEHINGTPGAIGSQYKLRYKMGKREIEMIETIIKRDLPDEFSAVYEAKGVWNEVKNHFTVLDDQQTLWKTENTFHFKGGMKVMAFLMPRAFKKQSLKFMQDFKRFAEKIDGSEEE